MAEMTLADGTVLAHPLRREVHSHGWQWAREGTGHASCIEVVYPNPTGGERMFLHLIWDGTQNRYPAVEYLFAVVNHYIGKGWRLEHCAATSAVLASP